MKVLYMSGYTDREILGHEMLMSDVNFIEKPFTPESLKKKCATRWPKEWMQASHPVQFSTTERDLGSVPE